MPSETLQTLVSHIRFSKIRIPERRNTAYTCWTEEDEQTLYKVQSALIQVMETYGADYSLIQHYFPMHSRKQIRRKFQELERKYERALKRAQARRQEQQRKNYFDEEILDLIRWREKPNMDESTKSPDHI